MNRYANSAGLDTAAFASCMDGDEYQRAYINDRNYARSEGVNATPTFLVNGQLVMASELESTVEMLLEN